MTKLMKISIFLIIISIILPLIAYKIKPPKFISSQESIIAQFQETTKVEIIEKREFDELSLNDPFKFREKKEKYIQKDSGRDQSETVTLSLIYQGRNKFVIINNEIAKESEKVDNFTVAKVLNDKVLIKEKKGEKRWLKLENY